ncbi:MAG TPA: M56 family metallopeptidase [Flavisolibacter sp.]|nr:M56 family metallopeptidase [Flavisolibacter sp.]
MANWSQSHFLQSLGWATLNSFWQMALLWCIYLGISHLVKITPHKKYQLSVLAIAGGFAWFLFTFFYYYQSSPVSTISFFNQTVNENSSLLQVLLFSASVAYLLLLVFPSYRLYQNWRFVQRIKIRGLQKAELNYRLFVQKVSAQLGIRAKVFVYVSELVKSPVTIGYLKPIVLLPVAALNHLSTQQVEAILLHELSHIRRYDYLVNFMMSIVCTILYFNPFIKQFMRNIEEERETCCDQLVLQFGYDKVSYASALLTLEKLSAQQQVLAMCATGRNFLLSRIEKIVGMEKKKRFKLNHFAGILAALFCILIFNSVLIIREKKESSDYSLAFENRMSPFIFDNEQPAKEEPLTRPFQTAKADVAAATSDEPEIVVLTEASLAVDAPVLQPPGTNPVFINVAFDENAALLTSEQKKNVESAVDATKKILTSMQWKEVETCIADAMSEGEKAKARETYKKLIEQSVNWENVEQNMKAKYEDLDWQKINLNMANALTVIELDSLQKSYTTILAKLDKAVADACVKSKISVSPLPDLSIEDIRRSSEELRRTLDTIRTIRNPKAVIRL